jgi:two-component system heavy metal sensor histidine kinase CusS
VQVVIRRDHAEFTIAVVNEGDEVDPAALPHLFERFYRADKSRSGSSSHHGLGLTIVAAIARMHGGTTFATSDRGLTRIGFTLADASA